MEKVKPKKYGTDILIVGERMDAEQFETVKAALPEADQMRVIGWRRVGTLRGF